MSNDKKEPLHIPGTILIHAFDPAVYNTKTCVWVDSVGDTNGKFCLVSSVSPLELVLIQTDSAGEAELIAIPITAVMSGEYSLTVISGFKPVEEVFSAN